MPDSCPGEECCLRCRNKSYIKLCRRSSHKHKPSISAKQQTHKKNDTKNPTRRQLMSTKFYDKTAILSLDIKCVGA